MRKGTLALSWGPSGGFYVHRRRVCLWWVAITFVPRVEIDDLMRAYVERAEEEVDGPHAFDPTRSRRIVGQWALDQEDEQ